MARTIAFIAQTPHSPSLEVQRKAIASEGSLIIEAGRLSPNEIGRRLRKMGIILGKGDRIKFYDMSCITLTTSSLLRFIERWRSQGITIDFVNSKLTLTPYKDYSDVDRAFSELASHLRMIHGQKVHGTRKNKIGRKPTIPVEEYAKIKSMLGKPGATPTLVAQKLGIPRSTLYDYLKRNQVPLKV